MKKVLFCLTLLLLCLNCAWAAELPDSVKDAVPPEAADILPEMDTSASHETLWQGLGDLWHSACAYVRTALETQASGVALLLGVVLVYLIMVAQFQSLKSPFIVMFTIPLAFTGGLLGMLVTGQQLTMISLMGFIVLMVSLPATSPITFMTSHWLAFWRRLSTMASCICSFCAKARARATEPTSGETTIISSHLSPNFLA